MILTPLADHALAPNFSLTDESGTLITRGGFRNRSGLVLIFVQTEDDPVVRTLIAGVARDLAVYQRLNARPFVIAPVRGESALPLLQDGDGAAWQAYSEGGVARYGVFVLDLYGGVDSQAVTDDPAELPDAATLLEWAQAAMYRCNV